MMLAACLSTTEQQFQGFDSACGLSVAHFIYECTNMDLQSDLLPEDAEVDYRQPVKIVMNNETRGRRFDLV